MKYLGIDYGTKRIGVAQSDAEVVRIQFFEDPGIQMTPALEKEVEKHFTRRELRRVPVQHPHETGFW